MKIAIAFYGITRSLKYTINSIEESFFNVFKENNIDYDIYIHTYSLNTYENKRTNEIQNDVDNDEYKLLKPTYAQRNNQDDVKKQIDIESYRTYPDPWNTEYNSVDNFILACYSRFQVTNIIKNKNIEYDYILFTRPDCMYPYKFNVEYLRKADNNNIVIPLPPPSGKPEFNDRFCITNMKTYTIYGNLFQDLFNISKERSLHAEQVLEKYLKKHVSIKKIYFPFARIRCNGSVANLDKYCFNKKLN